MARTIAAHPDYHGKDGFLCKRPNSWTGYVYEGDRCIRIIKGAGTKRQALAMAAEAAAS